MWVAASLAGYFAGAFVPEPRRFGLDLVMPIFFGMMLVPLWKGRTIRPALAGGRARVPARPCFVPGYLFIVVGALAGVATGMLMK